MAARETADEMSFWDHIDALRKVLVQSSLVILGVSILFFSFMKTLFDQVILAPTSSDFIMYRWLCQLSETYAFLPNMCHPFRVELVSYNLNSQFFIHMTSSVWISLVVTFPIVIYLIWNFVSPALYDHEKQNARWAFLFGNAMFYLGLVVGYFVIFPMTLRFLATYQVSEMVPNMISLDSYMSSFLTQIFVMGLVFEMPLLCWVLSGMGLLRRSFFRTYRRYAFVVLLIIAAIITPADPFSMILMFIPLFLLYEGSAFIVKEDEPEVASTTDLTETSL